MFEEKKVKKIEHDIITQILGKVNFTLGIKVNGNTVSRKEFNKILNISTGLSKEFSKPLLNILESNGRIKKRKKNIELLRDRV